MSATRYALQYRIRSGEHAGTWRTFRVVRDADLANRCKARAEADQPGCVIRILEQEERQP